MFVVLEVHWTSWNYEHVAFSKFRNYLDIIYLNFFMLPFFQNSNYKYIMLLKLLLSSQMLYSFFLHLLSLWISFGIVSIATSSSSVSLLLYWINLLLIPYIAFLWQTFLVYIKIGHIFLVFSKYDSSFLFWAYGKQL